MIGVTDEFGKFFDLQFVNDNMKTLKKHQLELVTVKDSNDDGMSFGKYVFYMLASDNVENIPQKKQ